MASAWASLVLPILMQLINQKSFYLKPCSLVTFYSLQTTRGAELPKSQSQTEGETAVNPLPTAN